MYKKQQPWQVAADQPGGPAGHGEGQGQAGQGQAGEGQGGAGERHKEGGIRRKISLFIPVFNHKEVLHKLFSINYLPKLATSISCCKGRPADLGIILSLPGPWSLDPNPTDKCGPKMSKICLKTFEIGQKITKMCQN